MEGKVALITGGARGQGASEAALFRSEGATVYITDVLTEEGKATAAETGATFFEHDVTDPAAWQAVVEEIDGAEGGIDVLINNAGIFHVVPMVETDMEMWERMIAINQTGVFLGMKTVAPIMQRNQRGSIINISSIAGLAGSPNAFAYSATKWAVRGMTKGAAKELAAFGVRVNSIHPGIIDTPMLHAFEGAISAEELQARIPAGRVAKADEVAKMALYLASDDSEYCTGSEFVIDGGWTA